MVFSQPTQPLSQQTAEIFFPADHLFELALSLMAMKDLFPYLQLVLHGLLLVNLETLLFDLVKKRGMRMDFLNCQRPYF